MLLSGITDPLFFGPGRGSTLLPGDSRDVTRWMPRRACEFPPSSQGRLLTALPPPSPGAPPCPRFSVLVASSAVEAPCVTESVVSLPHCSHRSCPSWLSPSSSIGGRPPPVPTDGQLSPECHHGVPMLQRTSGLPCLHSTDAALEARGPWAGGTAIPRSLLVRLVATGLGGEGAVG